jgi:uncharacterized protein (DUF362 family)
MTNGDEMTKVAIVEFNGDVSASFQKALHLLGGISELNTPKRDVAIKVGIFYPRSFQYSSVDVVGAIIEGFSEAQRIYLAESDNYQGTGSERLQLWKELFTERVVPFNLSEDTDTRPVKVAKDEGDLSIDLSHILFKPNVFVSTHVLRTFQHGMVLKNLFGLPPIREKRQYHKKAIFRSIFADLFEAIGGIDLSVIDGTHLYWKYGNWRVPMNILIVGRDAVAVETVGVTLAGLRPKKLVILQEFIKRGLGEGDIDNIEVVGVPFEEIRARAKTALKKLNEIVAAAPKPWSPRVAVDGLIQRGFFRLPHRRVREEIEAALAEEDARSKGRWSAIYTTMIRRIKKGKLNRTKEPDGWVYWTE